MGIKVHFAPLILCAAVAAEEPTPYIKHVKSTYSDQKTWRTSDHSAKSSHGNVVIECITARTKPQFAANLKPWGSVVVVVKA